MASDIVWIAGPNVTITGNDVEKTGGADLTPNAWADADVTLGAIGDYIEFKIPLTTKLITVGFLGASHTAAGITHAFNFSAGTAEIREAANYKGETSHAANDLWKIAVGPSGALYYKNGVQVSNSSPAAITLPVTPTVLITGLNGKITDAQSSVTASGPTVPITYDAITDRLVRPDTVVPNPGAAGTIHTDPLFSCPILRVTDADTGTATGTQANYSHRPPSAPNQSAWNCDATRFYTVNDSATVIAWTFNPTTQARTFDRTLAFGIEPAFSSLTTKPNIIYGVRFITNHVIEKFDFANTGAGYVEVIDLKDVDVTLDNTVYTSSLYTSGGPVERCVVNYGGTGQDMHFKVSVFNIDDPLGTIRTINMLTNTINGVQLLDQNGVNFSFAGVRSHSISISGDGNTVRIDPVGTSNYFWLYDWTLNRIKKVTVQTNGHYAMGRNKLVNENAGNKPEWRVRSLALANTDTTDLRATAVPGIVYHGDHTSWRNSWLSDANADAPFFSEWQRVFTDTHTIYSNEILGIKAVGTETVWRFCHHHMEGNGDVGGTASQPFFYQPLAQVDPTGRFVMFGSNWNKTLGNHPNPPSADAAKRVDTFIVKLGRVAGGGGGSAPTVSLTSPASGASVASGGSFTLTANAADSGGSIASVEFFANGVSLGSDNSSPYSIVWSNLTAGSYSLTAVATDNEGLTTTSTAVPVTVTSIPTLTFEQTAATSSQELDGVSSEDQNANASSVIDVMVAVKNTAGSYINLTNATSILFIFRKANGVIMSRNGSRMLAYAGSDPAITAGVNANAAAHYVTTSSDFDVPGIWRSQCKVVVGGVTYYTEPKKFAVR